jgi:quercetin dioxygenase-like cupin family protein
VADEPTNIALGPDGGEHLERGPRHHRVLVELPEVEVFELRFGPDFEGVPPHTHSDHVDSFYVLEGKAEFTIDGETVLAGPGSWVSAAIGVEHGFRNTGGDELRVVNVHAPNTGFGQRMREG